MIKLLTEPTHCYSRQFELPLIPFINSTPKKSNKDDKILIGNQPTQVICAS